jgi:hypothetical protein
MTNSQSPFSFPVFLAVALAATGHVVASYPASGPAPPPPPGPLPPPAASPSAGSLGQQQLERARILVQDQRKEFDLEGEDSAFKFNFAEDVRI